MIVSILQGKVEQLSIFGQLEFVHGNDYNCYSMGDYVKVVGEFRIVGTDDFERVEIEMTSHLYTQHINLS